MSHQQQFLRKGELEWARLAQIAPTFSTRKAKRGRRAAGLRYEKKAHIHFMNIFGERYVPSPWIEYKLKNVTRIQHAQPDSLLVDVDEGRIVICEIKYQHCIQAYWQLLGKYVPLMEMIFPPALWKLSVVEITQWYDCAVKFPVKVKLRKEIHEVREKEFGVHIWKP